LLYNYIVEKEGNIIQGQFFIIKILYKQDKRKIILNIV